jgi:cytochrome P450
MKSLWHPILKSIQYISPGMWILWPDMPRPSFRRALQELDDYLYKLIAWYRVCSTQTDSLIGMLIEAGMNDDLIRDQLLTLLIAGHDTSTAMLAWTLYLLSTHPPVLARVRDEVDQLSSPDQWNATQAKSLRYLGQVISESLRLYPPIHLGSRIAARDLSFQDYLIPAGTRVMYSIYLTHRHPTYWPEPAHFNPERFSSDNAPHHYTFLPFGGGPRNCMGMAFAQLEARSVLARIIQCFDLRFVGKPVRISMKATLEPHHGVMINPIPR